MNTKYAGYCTRCHKVRTKHPSCLCAACRRAIESGSKPEPKEIQIPYDALKEFITFIVLRMQGCSLEEIIHSTGMSEQQVTRYYFRLVDIAYGFIPEADPTTGEIHLL